MATRSWPMVGARKVQEAEQAFTGWMGCQHHRQHKRKPRGKQCESGCWPVGPSPQRLGLPEDQDLRGRRGFGGSSGPNIYRQQTRPLPYVLPCERLGDVISSRWAGPSLGQFRDLGLLWYPPAFQRGSLDLTEHEQPCPFFS